MPALQHAITKGSEILFKTVKLGIKCAAHDKKMWIQGWVCAYVEMAVMIE